MKETIPSVSVIIPVYNTESFLVECLESIVNQNFRNMEIIIVNDGSTDGSLDIICRYSEQDNRIVILNKSNQGASAARNDAINMAKADYIMFLDSDDIYKTDLVKTAYSRISGKTCDILIFNGRAFEDDGEKKRWHKKFYFNLEEKDENHIAPGLYWIERTAGRIQQPGMKIYRRQFIMKNNLKFGDSLIGEDCFFFYMCMINARRVAYMHFDGYFRRYRSSSHMTDESIRGTLERIKSFEQILTTLNFVKDEKYHRIISAQHAYYASVLWVNCLLRRNVSERDVLLTEFQKARLDDYIRRNRYDWKLLILSFIVSLPESMILFKITFARAVKLIFKSHSRLL